MSERVTNTKIKKTRKKHNVLTIEQKIEILKKVKKGVSKDYISAHYNIHKRTINYIIRSRNHLFKKLKQGKNIKRKTDQSSKFLELNNKLYEWYQNNKSTITITKKLLYQEACRIATLTQTKLSNIRSFVKQFMKRYGISESGNTNENLQCSLQHDDEANQFDENFIRELQLNSTRNRRTPKKNTKLDEQLYERYQKQKASGKTINQQQLREAAFDIAKVVGEPKNMRDFLYKFKKQHNIVLDPINNSEIVQNSVQRDDEVNRSDENFIQEELQLIPTRNRKNLDEQLFEWCQKRKESGDTINLQLLREAALDIAKEVGELSNMSNFLDQFIEGHNIVLEPINNSEILQNSIQRDDETNQCNAEKFFQEIQQRLKKGDIKKYNIYIMFQADFIWNTLVDNFLVHANENKNSVQQYDIDLKKKISTYIFCTNITNSNRLFPFHIDIHETNEYENQSVSEYCKSKLLVAHKLQEHISAEQSKSFSFWYYSIFKSFATMHQESDKKIKKEEIKKKEKKDKKEEKKNEKKKEKEEEEKLEKIVLLVAYCTQRIFSKVMLEDKDVEIVFLPINLFSKLLCPKIEKMDQTCHDYLSQRISNSSCNKETEFQKILNRNFDTEHNITWCTVTLNMAWTITPKEIKKLWKNLLREDCRIRDNLSTLTSATSENLIKSTGKDTIPCEISTMHISCSEGKKEEHQEQGENIDGTKEKIIIKIKKSK